MQNIDSLHSQQHLVKKESRKNHKEVEISFQNITYSIEIEDKEKPSLPCKTKYVQKKLLDNVSGIFKPGEVTAIMGASGAGKTTLLNVLACRVPKKNLEGKIYSNNTEYNFDNFGDFANYVMQSDVLMETLTVRETLNFAANLKLNISQQEKDNKIQLLSNKLKLEKCLDVLVGGRLFKGISGGEKKRTSIAFELISDPQVLILDQPTSGLDSLTSFIIVQYMKKLSEKQKKTIFMTIHQPNSEIFDLFDRLILLVQGRIIYQGPAKNAVSYFSSNFNLRCPQFHNPADFYMSIMHHESIQNKERYPKYFSTYEKAILPGIDKQIENRNTAEFEKRVIDVPLSVSFGTLIDRDIKNTLRNPMLIKLRFIQTVFISIYAGGLYAQFTGDYRNRLNWSALIGFFFFSTINLLMFGLAPVQLVFPSQRSVFLKEEGSKLYSVFAYFLSRNLIQLPYSIVFPLLQCLIMYWFIGLNSTPQQFFTFYLIAYLLNFNGSSLGLMLGSVVQDQKSMAAITPILLLPLFLFSGLFKNSANLPDWIGWIQYLSPIKYAFIGFVQNQVLYATSSNVGDLAFDVKLWPSIAILAGIGIALRLISLFFLWFLRAKLE